MNFGVTQTFGKKVQDNSEKSLKKLPVARDSDRVVKLRKEKIEEWEATQNLDFTINCAVSDEAWFNLHTWRNFGRLF